MQEFFIPTTVSGISDIGPGALFATLSNVDYVADCPECPLRRTCYGQNGTNTIKVDIAVDQATEPILQVKNRIELWLLKRGAQCLLIKEGNLS